MARIVKHRKALRDILQIFVYVGQRNMDAAERFLVAFDSYLKRFAQLPKIGGIRKSSA
jgi:plasmid stabilization system protein ParE